MIPKLLLTGFLVASLALVSCSDKRTPAYNPDVGPFDEDGNYIEAWADNPPKRGKSSRSTPPPPPEPRIVSAPEPRVTPTPPPKVTPKPAPAPKPKPKPKPAPKPKPVVVRHTVQKGDTLYSLSRRYGTSVSAIQKANGLSGTTIRTGSTLTIPK